MPNDPAPNLPARLKLAREARESLEDMSHKASVKVAVIVNHFSAYEDEITRLSRDTVSREKFDELARTDRAQIMELQEKVRHLEAEIKNINRQRAREVQSQW
jgi:hypothetical protein